MRLSYEFRGYNAYCHSVLMTYDLILASMEYRQVVFTYHSAQVAGNLYSNDRMRQLAVLLYRLYHNLLPIPKTASRTFNAYLTTLTVLHKTKRRTT
jgi:hypothetical protein